MIVLVYIIINYKYKTKAIHGKTFIQLMLFFNRPFNIQTISCFNRKAESKL
ncbi:hypothetical protein Hanom_Chr00s092290g01799531 [Helianthus anomalus]